MPKAIKPAPRAKREALPPEKRAARQQSGSSLVKESEDEEEILGASDELVRAERMWKERMGKRRYHDDPRALREYARPVNLLPPFMERPE